MPYHVSLSDLATEQNYRVVIVDELDRATSRHLGDWLEAARLNPRARFELDLSEARWVDRGALRRLLERHRSLAAERRLSVVGEVATVPSRLAALPLPALVALEPLVAGVF